MKKYEQQMLERDARHAATLQPLRVKGALCAVFVGRAGMRTYIPGTWEITKERYIELRAFCRQYPQWKVEADNMLGVSGAKLDDMPHGTDVGDPTGRAVERRERILAKIDLVEGCAAAIDRGAWQRALILNVCNGMAWEIIRDLHPDTLKNNDRSHFFKARRMFFNLLDKEKE